MADHSKEYDSDDERSISVSHRSKSEYQVNESDSPSLEHSDAYCDDFVGALAMASKTSEKRTSKGQKVVAALRNAQHDRLIDEYKTQFPKPESTDDEMSVQSSQKSAQSDDECDAKGTRTVATYGHSSKQRDSEYHHLDTLQILRYSKEINDASESDGESSKPDGEPSEREEDSKDHLQSKHQSDSTHEVKTHSHKIVGKQILPPREKIYLTEQEPSTNQVDVERVIEPKMKPVSFDGMPIGLPHPPPIHIDFGKQSPVEEDELSELYSSDNEDEQHEHVITSTHVTEEKHEAGAQAAHTALYDQQQEFESKKSIHDIASMFGGSVAQKRAEEMKEHEDEINFSEEPSKVKQNVPPIAQKYVDAVNAAPVIKNRTSAFDELAFHDEEQEPEASEHEQQEERVEDEQRSESEAIEKHQMSEEERFMSVRVVRNVREYVREHGGTDDMIIKIPAYAKKEQLLSTKDRKQHGSTYHKPTKKEAGVQVSFEQDRGTVADKASKQSTVPLADRRKVFESIGTDRIITKDITEKKKHNLTKVTSRHSSTDQSSDDDEDSVSNKSDKAETEQHEVVREQPKQRVKVMPLAQRRQLYETVAANASSN